MLDQDFAELIARVPKGTESAFPREEYDLRLTTLRQRIFQRELDVVLVAGPENTFYLTGQQTPGYYTLQALGVPASGPVFLVLCSLEAMNARLNSFVDDITGYLDEASPAAAVTAAVKARGYAHKRIGVDRHGWFVPVNMSAQLEKELGEFQDASGLVEQLRRLKSPLELAQIAKAGLANDAGMAAGLVAPVHGANENEIAAAVMSAAIKSGSEYVGMEPFVTSGPRSGGHTPRGGAA